MLARNIVTVIDPVILPEVIGAVADDDQLATWFCFQDAMNILPGGGFAG
jgi:hypothetical protein